MAPAVMPVITILLSIMYKMAVGMTLMAMEANVGPHWRWPYCPTKLSRPV